MRPVKIEAQIIPGIAGFNIIGLCDKAVFESKERIKSAFHSMGISMPMKKIVISLSPSDIPKEGSHYDLGIAISILILIKILPHNVLNEYIIMGELALDGTINKTKGILPAAIFGHQNGLSLICPGANTKESSVMADSIKIIAPNNLKQIIEHFNGTMILKQPKFTNNKNIQSTIDFNEIKGHKAAKRAMKIAAAGKHNILMIGSPGAGKSLLANAALSILPDLSFKQSLETTMIHSVSGMLSDSNTLIVQPPFRCPHHSSSFISIVGGGHKFMPGEISLAHNGILFLDEIAEFSQNAIETLRQPIETKNITIARANFHLTYPAAFWLIAAMNPCKCGFLYEDDKKCSMAPNCGFKYTQKISGPIWDRFDMIIHIENTKTSDFFTDSNEQEKSEDIKKQIAKIKPTDQKGLQNVNQIISSLSIDCKTLISKACQKYSFSIRTISRIINLAKTIQKLEEDKNITKKHILEAINYKTPINFKNKQIS